MSFVIAPTRVFCTAVLGLLLAASSLLLPSSGPGSVASAIAPAPSAANCQNTAPLGMSGTWTCSFDDEFSGTSLDTTKWIPQPDGEQWVHDRNDLGLALLRRQPGSLTIYRGRLRRPGLARLGFDRHGLAWLPFRVGDIAILDEAGTVRRHLTPDPTVNDQPRPKVDVYDVSRRSRLR